MLKRRIVLTGSPGAGKTVVIDLLQKKGFTCHSEVPRLVMEEQKELIDGILPQTNFMAFAELVINRMVEQYWQESSDLCFFDRGIPDVLAYCNNAELTIPVEFFNYSNQYKYNKKVFFFPPWKEIYEKDCIRYETFEQAKTISEHLMHQYRSLLYEIIEIPRLSPVKRVQFILDHLKV
ncbi:MAG: AAA family ATPase [Carboxylicivirga sp.]|jgi:predicted ATPase|nr:AAA family ATPase [Carboxylicivirga sp.]